MATQAERCKPGESPFLCDDPLVDVLTRLGFSLDNANELVGWWWFMSPGQICPDDLAAELMRILPQETDQQAEKRRSLARSGLEVPKLPKLRSR